MNPTEETNAAAADAARPESFWSDRNVRILKLTVIIMSVLIVLGLIVLFGTIVNRVVSGRPADDRPALTVPVPADVNRLLDAEAEIVSTQVDSGRMAIVVKRPEGHSVIVLDLRSGEILNVLGDAGR